MPVADEGRLNPCRHRGSVKEAFFFFAVCLWVLTGCQEKSVSAPGKTEPAPVAKVTVEKERLEREPAPPREVKIKLKRDGKDNYSWELSSSDVDQLLKVNDRLRKHLIGESSR
jgi:hypothetical protein